MKRDTLTDTLPFGTSRRAIAVEGLVPSVLGYLSDRGWVSAKQLASHFGTTDRVIRAVAAASQGQIISGQKGYALCSQVPVSEALHAASWLRHQAQEMTKRAYQIEQAMHRRRVA